MGLKRCFSAYAPHVTWAWEGGFPLVEGIQKATWISPTCIDQNYVYWEVVLKNYLVCTYQMWKRCCFRPSPSDWEELVRGDKPTREVYHSTLNDTNQREEFNIVPPMFRPYKSCWERRLSTEDSKKLKVVNKETTTRGGSQYRH